jgi:hypothetical protein
VAQGSGGGRVILLRGEGHIGEGGVCGDVAVELEEVADEGWRWGVGRGGGCNFKGEKIMIC